jgi:hypothetical protein
MRRAAIFQSSSFSHACLCAPCVVTTRIRDAACIAFCHSVTKQRICLLLRRLKAEQVQAQQRLLAQQTATAVALYKQQHAKRRHTLPTIAGGGVAVSGSTPTSRQRVRPNDSSSSSSDSDTEERASSNTVTLGQKRTREGHGVVAQPPSPASPLKSLPAVDPLPVVGKPMACDNSPASHALAATAAAATTGTTVLLSTSATLSSSATERRVGTDPAAPSHTHRDPMGADSERADGFGMGLEPGQIDLDAEEMAELDAEPAIDLEAVEDAETDEDDSDEDQDYEDYESDDQLAGDGEAMELDEATLESRKVARRLQAERRRQRWAWGVVVNVLFFFFVTF